MIVQSKLKGILVERGINQEVLANKLDISREMINRKINGNANFTLKEAFVVAEFLNLKMEDIFLQGKLTQTEHDGLK